MKIGGGILLLLLSHVLPLKEEREEDEGGSRSPLGAKQGTLRECFGLRWTKKITASTGRVETYCTHSLRVSDFIVIAMCFP